MLRQLLVALHADSAPPSRRHRGSMSLRDVGDLTELLANPELTRCPHCNRPQPPVKLRTRKRRLYELRGPAGQLLHYEIEP